MFNLGSFLGGLGNIIHGAQSAVGNFIHPQQPQQQQHAQPPSLGQFLQQHIGQQQRQAPRMPTVIRSINNAPIRPINPDQRQAALNIGTAAGIGPKAPTPLPVPQAKQSNPAIGTAQSIGQSVANRFATAPGANTPPILVKGTNGKAALKPNLKPADVQQMVDFAGGSVAGESKFANAAGSLIKSIAKSKTVQDVSKVIDKAKGQGTAANIAPQTLTQLAATKNTNKIASVITPDLKTPAGISDHLNFIQSQLDNMPARLKQVQQSIETAKDIPAGRKQVLLQQATHSINTEANALKAEQASHIQTLTDMGRRHIPEASIPQGIPGEPVAPKGAAYAGPNSYVINPTLQTRAAGFAKQVAEPFLNKEPSPTSFMALMRDESGARPVSMKSAFEGDAPTSTKAYVKQMSKAQELAAKGDNGPLAKIERFYNEAKTKLVDSTAPIEDVFRAATDNGKGVPASQDIRYKIDNALRAPTMAGQFVKDSGLTKTIQAVPDVKTFDQYLIARHAQDLRAKGIETGRNGAADDKLVKELAPQYEPHAKTVTDYSRKLLDYATQKGLVSKELNKHLKAEYPNYVPVNRIFGENELQTPKGNGAGIASKSTQTVVQKLKGSKREIESPLQSLLAKTHDAFQQGEVNDAAKTLTSYKDLPGNPFSLRELKPKEAIGNKNTISVLDNGKKRVFETTPEIAAAAKSLNKEQLGLVGKILSYPTRVLRLGATGINLPFVASNMVKDSVTAVINSSNPLKTSVANPKVFLQSMAAAVGHGKQYQEMVRNGAGGTSMDIGRDAAKQSVQAIRAGRNAGSNIAYTVTHPGELLRAVENTVARSEEYGRAMQYLGTKQAELAKGTSEAEAQAIATQAARTNTTNFARGGDYAKVVNSVLPFFNAGIQGSRTLVRNLHDKPLQTGTKIALTTFVPMAAVTAWNTSDPERKAAYDNIKDFEKQGNIIIVPPHPIQDPKTGKWNVIKIPLSQEIANLASVVRSGVEAMSNDKSMDISKIAGDLLGTATSLNLGSGRDLVNQFTPQAIKPGVEALTNTNLFTGNTIVPQSLQNFPTRLQYKPTTSGTAVKIGQAIGVSPLQVENAIRTATGGVGAQALNASDQALAAVGAIPKSQVNGTNTLDSMAGRFNQASGTSQAELDYQAKIQATKDKNAGKIPKQLQGIVPGSAAPTALDTSTGRDVLAASKTRGDKATANLPTGISKASSDTLTRYAKLSAEGKAKFNADPANKLKLNQAQYEQNKLQGKLTGPKDFAAQTKLGKEAITSKYSQDVLDFYGMSKSQQSAYFKQDPTAAKDLYDQSKKLDAELGGTKYKYGLGTKPKSTKLRVAKASKTRILATSHFTKAKSVKLPKFASLPKPKGLKIAKVAKVKIGKKTTLTA